MNKIVECLKGLVIFGFICSCSADSESDKLSIAILGQSIIEHDPRDYYENPLETVVPLLMENDVVFTNLEVAISGGKYECDTLKKGTFFHGATPDVLDYLKEINVNLLSLSNNHSFDFGECGIISTIHEVAARNFFYAGTGSNLAEATTPGYIEVNGLKIALISFTSTGGNERESILTPGSPCVNYVIMDDPSHLERVYKAIEEAKGAEADIIFVYHHWHGHDEIKVDWAHELIDRGVDLYVSQGYPEMGGIEIYKGKPLFYNLKNFIFHTKTDIGHYGNAAWENVFATMEYSNGKFKSIKLYPVIIDEGEPGEDFFAKRGYPEIANPQKAMEILTFVQDVSARYNTIINIENNIGIINIPDEN